MAKLSSLKMRKDFEGREIKCLMVEDVSNGNYVKIYDPKKITKMLSRKTKKENYIKVFNPNKEEKESIFAELTKDIVGDEIQFNASGEMMVFSLVKKFTDIEIDIETDEELQEILDNPSMLFMEVRLEMEKILMEIVEMFMSKQKLIASNPQISEELQKQIQEEAQLKLEEETKKQQEIEDLKKRLAELGN